MEHERCREAAAPLAITEDLADVEPGGLHPVLTAIGRVEDAGEARRRFIQVADDPTFPSVKKVGQVRRPQLRWDLLPLPVSASVAGGEQRDAASPDHQPLDTVRAEPDLRGSGPVPRQLVLPGVPAVGGPEEHRWA